jgi:hypothetical protein
MTYVPRELHASVIAANSSATPLRAKVFGYAAVAPIAAGVAATMFAPAIWRGTLFHAVVIWSASILCFLAGVRRGDSFHTPNGPTLLQMPGIFCVWAAGLAALVAAPVLAVVALLIGFCGVAVFDTVAARHRLAPLFFARFRPIQMLIPIASLAVLLAWSLPMRATVQTGWECGGGFVCLGPSNSGTASSVVGVGFTNEGHHGERYYF